jgi:choline-phosphate cytidylyltransferase
MTANCDPRNTNPQVKARPTPLFVSLATNFHSEQWNSQKQSTTRESFTVNGLLGNPLVTRLIRQPTMRPSSVVRFPSSFFHSPLFSSEEDNDPFTDDGSSALSVTSSTRQNVTTQHRIQGPLTARPSSPSSRSRLKHALSPSILSDDGVDSPTYDGDIESSTTVGRDREPSPVQSHSAATSTLPSPAPIIQNLPAVAALIHPPSTASSSDAEIEPARVIVYNSRSTPIHGLAPVHDAAQASDPSAFSPEGIQAFIRRAINGEPHRKYKINDPPVSRPVRVYADGAYWFRLRRFSLANSVPPSRCI